MNIRDRIGDLTWALYEDGSQAAEDNQAGDGSIRGSELEIVAHRLENELIADLEALIEAASQVMADRDAYDDESWPVNKLRKALAKFEDEEVKR